MKQYLLKLSAAALLLGLVTTGASAQQNENDMKPAKKPGNSDLIIVRTNDGKDAKVTIEVKDGEVKVNGKPLSEFKDDNVTITKRKQTESMVGGVYMPNSRFRVNADNAFNLANENFLRTYTYTDGGNKAFLGVTTEGEGGGAKIRSFVSDTSAAKKAGLELGDVIVRVNDQKVTGPEDLSKAIGKYKPQEKVTIVYKREGKELSKSIALGKRQDYAVSFPGFNQEIFDAHGMLRNRGRLGIKAQETEEGKGVKVLSVDDESPADNAGIKQDDIITEFDGTEVNDIDKLRELGVLAAAKVSFKVKLTRDGKSQEVTVKIPKNLKTTNL